ncbi:MAG TPA: LysR family transcriptional regulator [Azospira sp.]|nr:LysR family transcriptional regulator [Azospira sp.]
MIWLRSWESFVKVVENGSMAAAARRLDCTRAQISKQIGELEQAFGVRLFERSTRKLSLTPAGEEFYQHALRALEAIESTEFAVKHLGDVPRGVLRISATVCFGRLYIAPLLPRLLAKYPELECELILSDQVVDLVEDRIDLALRLTKAPPEEAVAKPLVLLQRVICAAPAYLAAHGTPKTPQDLLQHQCFSYLMTDNRVWQLADRQGNETSIPVRSRCQFNSIDCIHQAVLAGQGLAILPTYLCANSLARGDLVTVLDDYVPQVRMGHYLYACYTPSRVRVPKVRVFLAELEELFHPVPPWQASCGER